MLLESLKSMPQEGYETIYLCPKIEGFGHEEKAAVISGSKIRLITQSITFYTNKAIPQKV